MKVPNDRTESKQRNEGNSRFLHHEIQNCLGSFQWGTMRWSNRVLMKHVWANVLSDPCERTESRAAKLVMSFSKRRLVSASKGRTGKPPHEHAVGDFSKNTIRWNSV